MFSFFFLFCKLNIVTILFQTLCVKKKSERAREQDNDKKYRFAFPLANKIALFIKLHDFFFVEEKYVVEMNGMNERREEKKKKEKCKTADRKKESQPNR